MSVDMGVALFIVGMAAGIPRTLYAPTVDGCI